MKPDEERFDRLLGILRKSRPKPEDSKEIENEVISRIQQMAAKKERPGTLFDYLFGWVYIGWVRKSLVAASVFMVAFFAWQQSMILKRINALSDRPVVKESRFMTGIRGNYDVKMFFYKLNPGKIRANNNVVTEKQIDEFLKSVGDLQDKYRDLIKLIDEDPDLKKEIEKRLSDNHRIKLNL